ncbi:MAG: DUF4336 domain-containing protein [Bdellovibrionaceae bacterium]|nr:DUF4336 domain-containing protein [Pseudobdellovibrionaceae bacterium]
MTHQKIAPGVEIWTQDLKLMGIELGTRMTVIDLDKQGTLFVHSPVKLTEEIRAQLDAMGRVTYVVAPNKWHHLFINDFRNAYPQAQFFCAPGLETKRSDFIFDRIITDDPSLPWNPMIEHLLVQGAPMFNEVAFFHGNSRTLILTDTALHVCEGTSWRTKLFFSAIGSFGKFGLSRLEKWLLIKDRKKFQASMEKISQWDFDRVIVAHGHILPTDGKSAFVAAYL